MDSLYPGGAVEPCIEPYYPELELLGSAVGLAPRPNWDLMNPPILLAAWNINNVQTNITINNVVQVAHNVLTVLVNASRITGRMSTPHV